MVTCLIQYHKRIYKGINMPGGEQFPKQSNLVLENLNPWVKRNSHGHKYPRARYDYHDGTKP